MLAKRPVVRATSHVRSRGNTPGDQQAWGYRHAELAKVWFKYVFDETFLSLTFDQDQGALQGRAPSTFFSHSSPRL